MSRESCNPRVCGAGPPFPLLALPDAVLASILGRLPAGSVSGFPLALVLAQVRVTGSMDPDWLRPLLHLATRCPAVLARLARDLRSIQMPLDEGYRLSIKELKGVVGRLTHLEALCGYHIGASLLAALPAGITRVSLDSLGRQSPATLLSGPLQRLTKLEELAFGSCDTLDWSLEVCCPRLRRLRCGRPPLDLVQALPNLLDLETDIKSEDLPRLGLASSLTRLVCSSSQFLSPLSSLSGLVNIGDLCIANGFNGAELPALLGALTGLTRLELGGNWDDNHLNYLVEALARGPKDLGLCLSGLKRNTRSSALKPVFGHLVETKIVVSADDQLPWAALTRLTRLELEVDGRLDPSWINPLSQLPRLIHLGLKLSGQVPAGLRALTQCTSLDLEDVRSTAHLSELKGLTWLLSCRCAKSLIGCLTFLPDCLKHLHASEGCFVSSGTSIGQALQHLTALVHLRLEHRWSKGEDRVLDLTPLRCLTNLSIYDAPCSFIRLGPLPCLRVFNFVTCAFDSPNGLLQQLGRLGSLRRLTLMTETSPTPLTDAMIAPLVQLSRLEFVELNYTGSITPEGLRPLLDLPFMERFEILMDRAIWNSPAWEELDYATDGRLINTM